MAKSAPDLRLRDDIEQLSEDGLMRLRNAFRQSMQRRDDRGYEHHAGIYGLPLPSSSLHGTPLFLPWNRAWLYYFEEALRDGVPDVTLPFWDWTSGLGRDSAIPEAFTDETDARGENPLRSGPIPGLEGVEDTPRRTRRAPSADPALPQVDELRAVLALEGYAEFAAALEELHNRVHVWVGGDVAEISLAAYDPLNWSLSVMVDHVWHAWQLLHPEATLPPELPEQALAPFPMTVGQTLDIAALGYDYPPLRLAESVGGPSLARYASDLVDPAVPAHDLLGITAEVNALAALITQREVEPPLAVGLFGDWGSGKSFFMRLLRQRIAELATASAGVKPEDTAFCSEVDQITYNAWHHADADLWSSLVGESMQLLVEQHPELELPPGLASMGDGRKKLERRVGAAAAARAAAEAQRDELRAKRAAGGFVGAFRRFAGGRFFGLPAYLRDHPATLVVTVLGTVLLLVGLLVLGDDLGGVLTTITGGIALIGGLLRPLRDYESKEQAADRQLAEAVTADAAAREELSELYRNPVGLGTVLRDALQEFSAPLNSEDRTIERVVLYIDDLDRCSAQRVVDVLEAVHVLLAFRLFVVVVGVDSRWLLSSLRHVYRAQFGIGATEDAAWVTTPQNYLEKIFQIPFAVPVMGPAGFRRFISEMMGVDLPAARPDSAPSTTGAAPQTQPDDGAQPVGYASSAAGGVQLRPPSLEISPEELQFIASLGTIVSSPRAGKRLINTYRLLRAPLPEVERLAFARPPGEYRVVASLLAMMTGAPEIATRVFEAMLAEDDGTLWIDFSERLRAGPPAGVDGGDWDRLTTTLVMLDDVFGETETLATFRRWVPRVARYSFATSRLTARPLVAAEASPTAQPPPAAAS